MSVASEQRADERIIEEVTSWEGVEARPGSRGELSFRLGRRELGHLHGDRAAHFAFPRSVWAKLRDQGRIEPHPVFPDRVGPAARRIASDEDVADVIALMRLNYERTVAKPPSSPSRNESTSPPSDSSA